MHEHYIEIEVSEQDRGSKLGVMFRKFNYFLSNTLSKLTFAMQNVEAIIFIKKLTISFFESLKASKIC
jgi:hypothetical protein